MPNKPTPAPQPAQDSWLGSILKWGGALLGGVPGITATLNADQDAKDRAANAAADALRRRKGQAPLTNTERVRRTAGQQWQTLAQPIQGLAAMTVANSDRSRPRTLADVVAGRKAPQETGININGYRPALLDALPATVGALKSIGHAVAPSYIDAPAEGGYLANSLERMGVANDRTNATLGIENPRNIQEMGLNIAGSILLPGPEGLVMKAPGVAAKLGAFGATVPGKIARTAYEVISPLRQTSLDHAAATTIPAGVGLNEVAHFAEQTTAEPVAQHPDTDLAPEEYKAAYGHDAPTYPVGPPKPADMSAEEYQAAYNLPMPDPEAEKQSAWTTGAEVLAGLGFLAITHKVAKTQIARAPFMNSGVPSVVGRVLNRSRGSKVVRDAFESTLPIRTAANDFLTPAQAAQVNYRIDLLSSTSMGSKVRGFMTGGDAPGASRSYRPPARVVEAMAQQLTAAEQAKVNQAALFATSLDDFNRTGIHASLSDVPINVMKTTVAGVRADPKLNYHLTAMQQSYAELRDYLVDIGKITQAQADRMKSGMPNYVHMSRDTVDDTARSGMAVVSDANHNTNDFGVRNLDAAGAGVQMGQVRSPSEELVNQWTQAIKYSQQNGLRANALEQLAAAGGLALNGKPLVKAIPIGEVPHSMERVHTVTVPSGPNKGKTAHYIVNDPALDRAFQLESRAGWRPAEVMRQFYQSATTGVLGSLTNGFMWFKGPVYDTTMGMILKPKGVHYGLINEALNKFAAGANIGRFDPSVLAAQPIGALRYLFDDMTHAMSNNLTHQLLQDNSMMRSVFGDNVVTAFRDKLQQRYQTTIRALGDDLGVFSHNAMGSPDALKVADSLVDSAPTAARRQAIQAVPIAMQQSVAHGILAASKVPFIYARSSALGHLYGAINDAMHNGFRYQALASNKGRFGTLEELGSKIRRTQVDSSRHGSSQALNTLNGSVTYANMTMQTFYELGRMMHKDKVNLAANLASVAVPLATWYYLGQAFDPEARRREGEKTPEQRSRSVTGPGGIDIPLDPATRFAWVGMQHYIDYLSGMHNGEYNPAFYSALNNSLDGHSQEQEELDMDWDKAMHDAWLANMPYSIAQTPPLAAAAASMGFDPGLSSKFDAPIVEKPQQISGFDPMMEHTNGLETSWWDNVLASAAGSAVTDFVRTADEIYRAGGHRTGPADTYRIASEHWKDTMAAGAGPWKHALFGNYENVQNIGDTNSTLLMERQDGIKSMLRVYRTDVMSPAKPGNNLDPRFSSALSDGSYQLDDRYIGTPLQTIGLRTQALTQQTGQLDHEINALRAQRNAIKDDARKPVAERNSALNANYDRLRAVQYQKLMAIRAAEDQISQDLQERFTFAGFDPDAMLAHLERQGRVPLKSQ